MAASILPDTDVLVDFLRGSPQAVSLVTQSSEQIILSAVVVAELYAGVKGKAEFEALESFVSLFRVVPVSTEIAKAGGLLRRDYGKSHGLGIADAIVAATAQAEKAELRTLNVKHFPMIEGLQPAYSR
jgi:hypothetical protein